MLYLCVPADKEVSGFFARKQLYRKVIKKPEKHLSQPFRQAVFSVMDWL